jgi:pyruvate dehydrogenase E2 component (dihydrolipoamide acetyltransferase)
MKEFVLPSLGADMDEGMLAAWLVSPGDTVHRGDVIAEVETDKGIIEVECWEDAVIGELLVEPGPERLAVGTPIAVLRAVNESVEPAVATAAAAATVPSATPVAVEAEAMAHRISPPVRHLAHTLGVDVERVSGTGSGGVVTRTDVRHAAAKSAEPAPMRGRLTPRARRIALDLGVDPTAVRASRPDGLVVAEDVMAVTPTSDVATTAVGAEDRAAAMRRAIGRSMERSKREIPHYYLGHTIDLGRTIPWLDALNDDRPITTRILPAVPLLKATALALTRADGLNGHMVDGTFRRSDRVHLGVAVSLRGGGLVAPAIHDADQMSLDDLMAALSDLVARARAGKLKGSEMTDATATVTNLGDRGVDVTFPVIIPPQVAIIGFGRIADGPAVVDGQLVIRPTVQVSLAADHRVTDGHTGGLFLLGIERLLQEPELL